MKNKFQSNDVGMRLGGASVQHPFSIRSASDGRRWHSRGMQLICTLVLLFTFAVGNVWGAYDVPADGTVTLSQKVNNGGRFNVEASGVYHFRTSSGYSWDSSNGIKTQSNEGGVVFYLDASKEIEVGIVHTEAKNAHEVTVHVYSITESVYKQFDDNKAGAAESNRTFSTAPTSSTDGSFTISITAESKTFTGKKTLAAGYYAVVPVGEKSKTFFKTIKFTTIGGGTDVCPSGISITGEDEYTEGDKIELTAALTAGNGDISYQWYKGSVAAGNAISGATAAKYEKSNCTTADAGNYFCVASKDDCSEAVNASAFAITVAADTKCFNMPEITSKPADLAHVNVTGGTLSDVSTAKAVAMNAAGLKLDGNSVYLKVSLASASIVEGTKITVAWKGAGSGAGIALVNENLEHKVIDLTGISDAAGSISHTFTAAEAANYADEFIIHRNASGTGIYVNAITVEDCGAAVVKHTITLNYNDGVTDNGSIKVVHGNAATQPSDPERGKYTFLGWFVGDTDNEYVWSTAVNDDITLKAHWQDPWTITFDSDGGSAVADITVKHNTAAEKPADPTKDDYDFIGWYNGENAYDWSAAVTGNLSLTAHWNSAVAKYDVEYYDGETKIGTEAQVWANQHPTASGINTNKPLYTFVGWYTFSTLEGDPVALNTVTPVEGLKLYGKWTKAYATSYDMEAYAVSDGADVETLKANLTTAGYAYTNVHSIDNGHTHNYIYDGMKYKTNDGNISFNVAAGKLVIVKTGNLPSGGAVMNINGVADPTVFAGANEAEETHKTNYFYSGASDALFRLDMNGSKGTCILKAITIQNPFEVSFDENGGDNPVAAQYGTPSVTLPSATKGTESFLGWFIGEDKIGDAGDSYIPTANVELVAHWEAISTDARLSSITFSSDAGTLVPAWNMELTEYTYTMPYGTTAIPTVIAATANFTHDDYWYIESAATAWGETTIVRGKAVSGDTKAYNIKMEIAPKDGVCLIKGNVGSNTFVIDEEASLLSGTPSNSNVKSESSTYETLTGWKFNSRPAHLGLTLSEGTFQAGDVVEVFVTSEANGGGTTHKMRVFDAADATPAHVLAESAADMVQGANRLVLPATSTSSLYLHRGAKDADYQDWNPYVAYFAVYRPMNPMLTAMTIDGRTVTINEDAKTATVTIPYESDLANLTIAKTIVWNAPATENSIVVNGGSAWVIGENTYKLTDKDGDATTYTITVARDVLKHTVSFNTHGGSAVASELVVDGESLAAAPAAPGKEDYIFQGWAETDGGAIVDVTTFAISADKEFHAVWAPDGAIKLIVAGALNATDYYTGATMADSPVEIESVNYDYAILSNTASSPSGVNQLNKLIAYNAKTTQTKVMVDVYNSSTSGRNVYIKGVVEGSDEVVDLANVVLDNGSSKHVKTLYYEFNNAANRTIYISVPSSANTVYFLQVKVIESGTPLKTFGEAGYSFNLNKGRLFGPSSADLEFEGMNIRLSSNYAAVNSTVAKIKSTNVHFDVAAPVTMTVTTANAATYYVATSADGTTNETAKTGASEFDLTAGTWYINAGGSEVQLTNIAFAAPKCAEPVIDAQPATKEDFGAGKLTASVTAHATDGANLSYQWYNADGDVAVVGETATTATLETTTEGTYYVIITASKENYQNRTIKSYEATLGYRALNDATLSALSYGGTAIALEDGVYEYAVLLDEGTTVVPALSATATMATYGVTAVPTDAVAFVDYKATSTVLVTAEDGATTQTYTVKFLVAHEYTEIEDVTGNTSWSWAGVADVTSGDGIVVDGSHGLVLANYIAALNFEKLEAHVGARAYRSNSYPAYQGNSLKFHTTVAGKLVINARRSSGSPLMSVNGAEIATLTSTLTEYVTYVPAGDVTITVTGNEMRIYSMEFQVLSEITPSYTRDNLNPNNIGTLCWKNDGVLFGGTVYELTGKDEYNKLVFDEVIGNVIKGGKPCIFVPENGNTEIKVYNTKNEDVAAGEFHGMKGTYEVLSTVVDGENSPLWGNYIISNNKYIYVDYTNCRLGEYRAYILTFDQIPSAGAAPEPGQGAPRRRMVVGGNAPAVVTGIDDVQGDNVQSVKVLINGQLYILRGEQMFDATGRLVK